MMLDIDKFILLNDPNFFVERLSRRQLEAEIAKVEHHKIIEEIQVAELELLGIIKQNTAQSEREVTESKNQSVLLDYNYENSR